MTHFEETVLDSCRQQPITKSPLYYIFCNTTKTLHIPRLYTTAWLSFVIGFLTATAMSAKQLCVYSFYHTKSPITKSIQLGVYCSVRLIHDVSQVFTSSTSSGSIKLWAIPVQPSHHSRRITGPLRTTDTIDRLPYPLVVLLRQIYIHGRRILLQIFDPFSPGDRNEVLEKLAQIQECG